MPAKVGAVFSAYNYGTFQRAGAIAGSRRMPDLLDVDDEGFGAARWSRAAVWRERADALR
jgi:hypothetical protein